MTYLLFQHSQYATFDRPNKTDVMIITPGELVTRAFLRFQRLDVKVHAVAGQRSKKTDENKHGAVIPGCSAVLGLEIEV